MNGVDDLRWSSGCNNDRKKGDYADPPSPRSVFKHKRAGSRHFKSVPSFLSRCAGRLDDTSSPYASTTPLAKSPNKMSMEAADARTPVSKSPMRRSGPIMFSNSMGLVKPLPIEKKLECTLEELCHGCIKKTSITRTVLTETGESFQEEELLTIKVKPGWKSGTKITFEGMGDETPGGFPGDINFLIAEKWHPLFRREGDDLELAIEIPLVKALTGLNLGFPLLGGEMMELSIDDEIVHPGSVKIIEGQGMPNPKHQLQRGDLIIKFLVEFPTQLTEEQRLDIVSILKDPASP